MSARNAEGSTTHNGANAFDKICGLIELIDLFESGVLPATAWNHRARLAVAGWYLIHFDEADATERFINGVRRLNRIKGIRMTRSNRYHETLTLFWLAMSRRFLCTCSRDPVLAQVNGLLHEFGHNEDLYLEYYSSSRIRSWTARNRWVAPDLKTMPGVMSA